MHERVTPLHCTDFSDPIDHSDTVMLASSGRCHRLQPVPQGWQLRASYNSTEWRGRVSELMTVCVCVVHRPWQLHVRLTSVFSLLGSPSCRSCWTKRPILRSSTKSWSESFVHVWQCGIIRKIYAFRGWSRNLLRGVATTLYYIILVLKWGWLASYLL